MVTLENVKREVRSRIPDEEENCEMNHREHPTRIAITINSPRPHIPVDMLGCQSGCGMTYVPHGESRSEGGKGDFIPPFVSHRLDYSPQVNGIRGGYGAGSREWANPDFRGSTDAPPLVELKRSHRGSAVTCGEQRESGETKEVTHGRNSQSTHGVSPFVCQPLHDSRAMTQKPTKSTEEFVGIAL